ncbi:ATP-binding protein [Acinetobacter sp. C_4_1]|uniref:sensor histidine kinase n=1 Tax=unclassified Acinetobacter TaxID=196816 RepID=UPI0021B7BB64|nr:MULTISPECIES: ATP-binding protein [unclassified Acinetobacter]MCT8089162.1 ATP-binding protein [Acinetobacter sp. F_3_1]MCT8097317.1 ATP-binding protein [Acinetobacter sp. C_3_1]MCT8100193.1 ATP-binding protein [Acinetobacter sp. C_4_1]MCT8133383.1 ATP-binding protein [Acinetobacter sp. T_3_1]
MKRLIVHYFLIFVLSLLSQVSHAERTENINAQCAVHIHSIDTVKTSSVSILPKQGWESVDLPDQWNKRWPNYNGGVWYKIQWSWSCQNQARLADPIAFLIHYINSAGAVYLNGDLLWKDKHLQEPLSKSWNMPRYWVLPIAGLNSGENEILIYVNGLAFQSPGIGQISFNNVQNIYESYQSQVWNRRTLFLINLILSITFGVICFVIWLLRRKESTFGWFALSSFLWVLFISNILSTETFPYPNVLIAAQANLAFFVLYVLSFCIYLFRFIQKCFIKVETFFGGMTGLIIAGIFLTPQQSVSWVFGLIFLIYVGVLLSGYLYVCYQAIQSKRTDYIFLAICLSAIVIFMIFDLLLLSGEIVTDIRPLSPYTGPVITFFMVIILGSRLARNVKKIETFNAQLEMKVQQVSNDLSSSLNEKHQLELKNVKLQERINLSHDLHDGLGASLVRSMILVDQSTHNISNKQFLSMLKLLRDDLRQIIDSGSSADNKIPVSPVLWVAPVRHRFSQLMDELDIRSKWIFPHEWQAVPSALQCLTLIRVLEESLTNIIKHSQAKQVKIVMVYIRENQFILSIEDDGVGFDADSVAQQGLSIGMRSMKMRLERIGAELKLSSEPGCTIIQAIVQLK